MKLDPKIHKIDAPKSYNDSFWIDLAKDAEIKNGLPKGSLRAILKAEASNHGDISSKGAYTPFQISKKTRDDILAKDGYDAFESPENAVKAAVQVYKEGLSYSGGDPIGAAKFYNGGADGKKSPSTKAENDSYVNKFGSFFKRISGVSEAVADELPAKKTQEVHPDIIEAYRTGEMTPEDSKAFAEMYPQYVRGEDVVEKPKAEVLHPDIVEARNSGKMSPEDAKLYDEGIASGAYTLPESKPLAPVEMAQVPTIQPNDNYDQINSDFTGASAVMNGSPDPRVTDTIRKSQRIQSSPEFGSNALNMAFANAAGAGVPGNSVSMTPEQSSMQRADLTAADPEEMIRILKSNYPNLDIKKDEAGNYHYTSPTDGKLYAIDPQFGSHDILRMVRQLPAYSMGGASALGQIGVQTVMEGIKKLEGGDFNVLPIATAGALTAGLNKAATPIVAEEVKNLLLEGSMTKENYAQLALDAFKRDDKGLIARQKLASFFQPDSELKSAAENLKLNDLPSDILNNNSNARELAAITRIDKGSDAANAFLGSSDTEGVVQKVQNSAGSLLENNYGATNDVVGLNNKVKANMEDIIKQIKPFEKDLSDVLNNLVKPETSAITTNTNEAIKESLRGVDSSLLTPEQKTVYNLLTNSEDLQFGSLNKLQQMVGESLDSESTLFPGMSKRDKSILYGALKSDVDATVESTGNTQALEILKKRNELTIQRKGFENQLKGLFGKEAEESMVPKIQALVNKAGKGDLESLQKTILSIPEENRAEVLSTAIRRSLIGDDVSTINKFSQFHENLEQNPELKKFFTDTLGEDSEKDLKSINTIFDSVKRSVDKIKESKGAINEFSDSIKAEKNSTGVIASTFGRIASLVSYKTLHIPAPASSISAFVHKMISTNDVGKAELAHMLSSSHFSDLIAEAAKNGVVPNKVVGSLAVSEPFNAYAKINPDIPKDLQGRIKYINSIVQEGLKENIPQSKRNKPNEYIR